MKWFVFAVALFCGAISAADEPVVADPCQACRDDTWYWGVLYRNIVAHREMLEEEIAVVQRALEIATSTGDQVRIDRLTERLADLNEELRLTLLDEQWAQAMMQHLRDEWRWCIAHIYEQPDWLPGSLVIPPRPFLPLPLVGPQPVYGPDPVPVPDPMFP